MTAALNWFTYINEWELHQKVDFDGINKLIRVYPAVTQLDLRKDLYSAWVKWLPLQNNTAFLPAMRYSGFDTIPGGETGGSFFLINGWKLIINLESVAVTGVLYSEDFDTPYYNQSLIPISPIQVSSLVHSIIIPQNVIQGTKEEIASLTANTVINNPKTLTVPKFIGLK